MENVAEGNIMFVHSGCTFSGKSLVRQIYILSCEEMTYCNDTYFCFQSVFTQCIQPYPYPREPGCPNNPPISEGHKLPGGVVPFAPIYGRVIGGNLILDTSAPHAYIGPAGVTIFSDNLIIEGAVLVSGRLPFFGTVGLEGTVPTSGKSAVSYGCGNGDIGIVEIAGPVTEVILPAGSIGTPGCAGQNTIGLRL